MLTPRVPVPPPRKDILSRLHFCPTPVTSLGNWIPSVLYAWGGVTRSSGLAQAVFSSEGEKPPPP